MAKQVGYIANSIEGYDEGGKYIPFILVRNPSYIEASQQSELQKWLREEHNLRVRVDNVNTPKMGKWFYELQKLPCDIINLWTENSVIYDTYESALEQNL